VTTDDQTYKCEVVLWMKDADDPDDPDDQLDDVMRLPLLTKLKRCQLWRNVWNEKIIKTTSKGDGDDGPDVRPCSENWKFKVYFVDKKRSLEGENIRRTRFGERVEIYFRVILEGSIRVVIA